MHYHAGRLCWGNGKTRLRTVLWCATRSQQLEKGCKLLQQDYCTFKLALGQGSNTVGLPQGWLFAAGGPVTVSPPPQLPIPGTCSL